MLGVEKRPTSYRDSEPRTPEFQKKTKTSSPGADPKLLEKTQRRTEGRLGNVFSGFFSIFLSFLKEFGVGLWRGIFRFFGQFWGSGFRVPVAGRAFLEPGAGPRLGQTRGPAGGKLRLVRVATASPP